MAGATYNESHQRMDALACINGSFGGGQILRNAVALSAVTGRPVRVENIRASRPKPGLRPQHLLGLTAAADLCGASLTGAAIGSREIEFHPQQIRPRRDWRLDIGTAGSITLVLQCLLPALARAPAPSGLTLLGGTDVPFSPPIAYFSDVFVPALAEIGPSVAVTCEMRGFYPKGGGQVRVEVKPSPSLRPIHWSERGAVTLVRGISYSLGLPDHIAKRVRVSAANTLYTAGYRKLDIRLDVAERGRSEGRGIVLWAECESGCRLGASALGERGKRAERVGEEAAQALLADLASDAAVDSHLADQLIVWLALADGPSEFTAPRITDHLRSAIAVAEAITDARFRVSDGTPVAVRRLHPSDLRSGI